MNDRLLNNPVPPREIDPAISPELQEIIYRALEREPENRYASAREFAWDLEHLDQVGVAERPELHDWRKRRTPWRRRILFYLMLALIPVVIFGLLLLRGAALSVQRNCFVGDHVSGHDFSGVPIREERQNILSSRAMREASLRAERESRDLGVVFRGHIFRRFLRSRPGKWT